MNIDSSMQILQQAVERNAADIFMIPGMPISYKINGEILPVNDKKIFPDVMDQLIAEIYTIANNRDIKKTEHGDDDFSFSVPRLARFRASVMKQRGSLAAIIRVVRFELPDPKQLGIPDSILEISNLKKGLVLVTGSAGSGKSTTLSCIIDKINHEHHSHIITLEDPIEYLHRHNLSVVTQREVGQDTDSYVTGLRAALRQAPDVILLGEMRDYETINVAMTAAETGHLIFSTLHTPGAVNSIERIIDVFPASEKAQIAMQLSLVLQCVVSIQLIPDIHGQQIAVFEIMTLTPAIRNMIRDNKIPQIEGMLYASNKEDMISMDSSLLNLYKAGKITKEVALEYATNPDMLNKKLI